MQNKKIAQNHLQTLYLSLIGVLFLGIYYFCFNSKIFLGGDNIYYYNLGKALSEGLGFVTYNHPNMPLASHYPPGYPGIIALVMILISKSVLAIKILNGFFLFGSVITIFFLFKKFSDNIHLAFVGTILVILNPEILAYGSIMMSEIPFLFFSSLSLLFYINFLHKKHKKPPFTQLSFYVFILLLSITFHIKTLGVALLGGFVLYFLISRKWEWAISTIIGFLALALPWGIRNYSLGGSSYIQQLLMVNPYKPELGQAGISDFLVRILNNFEDYIIIEIPTGILPSLQDIIPANSIVVWILGSIVALIIFYGLLKMKNHSLLIGSFIAGILGILMVWPNVWADIRFLVPILPFLIFGFLIGFYNLFLYAVAKTNYAKKFHPIYLLILAGLFIADLPELYHKNQQPYPRNWAAYIEIAKWTSTNTASNAVISCRKPAIFNFFSDRKTFRFKDTPNHKELLDDLKQHNTNYVVLDQLGFSSTKDYLFPALKKYDNQFKIAAKISGIESYLLKFEPDSSNYE